MTRADRTQLEATLRSLHQRFGTEVLVPATQLPRISPIATGFDKLDGLLGGWPRGAISEVVGALGAGTTTLILHCLSHAQSQSFVAVYVDLPHSLDPVYAAGCGVDLSRLLIINPQENAGCEALGLTEALVKVVDLIVFDSSLALLATELTPSAIGSAMRRLAQKLATTPCALIFLTLLEPSRSAPRPKPTIISQYATTRLRMERMARQIEFGEVVGYHVHVALLAHPKGKAGASVSLRVVCNHRG